jgi:type II restriction enzyme
MNLQCRIELAGIYKSNSQIARVLSEEWCSRELYCAACTSDRLLLSSANTPAVDLLCPQCDQRFQLKSLRTWGQKKIVDAGYAAMIRAIRSDSVPNLLVLQYSASWVVKNLMLIPSVFFSESAIERRAPLSAMARRAGWIGCNILLHRIPKDGRIALISEGSIAPVDWVRQDYSRARRLGEVPPSIRGWTLDVLSSIRNLGKTEFSLREVYEHEAHLQELHPKNRNVRPKIRQQLQVLRDLGLVDFMRPGRYRRCSSPNAFEA